MNENVSVVFDAIAGAAGERVAISCADVDRRWADLEHRAAGLAGHLAGRGLAPGARVAIDLYSGIEYLEALYACMKARLVPVNVNYRYQETELRYLFADCEPAAVVYDEAVRGPVRAAAAAQPSIEALVQRGGEPDAGATAYEHAVAATPLHGAPGRSGEDLLLLYTGGTTGMPKGTVWRHADLLGSWSSSSRGLGAPSPTTPEEAAAIAAAEASRPERRVALPASPLMHATGLFTALGTLLVGGQVVLTGTASLRADDIWSAVERHRVTQLTIVGDAFARPLVDALEAAEAAGHPWDLTSLQAVSSVGVTWSAELKAALLQRADVALSDVVASSEGGPYALSVSRRGDSLVTARFVLAPGARLIDESGEDVVAGSGVVGVLAAPGFMPVGYLSDESKTAATFRTIDGVRYAVPGDQAILEADGTLTLLGRQSGVINTGGEKVFAEEVEQVLCTHPEVVDALVVGVPDARWGQRVVAVVAPAPGTEPSAEELGAHVAGQLARYKQPRQVVLVEQIRRTPVGKADRRWAQELAVRQLASASAGKAPATAPGRP